MKLTEEFDQEIKNGLVKAAQGVEVSSDLYSKIKAEINLKGDKVNMKGYSFRNLGKIKIALVSAVCVVVLTGTAVGAASLINKNVKG